jgi:dGTPase
LSKRYAEFEGLNLTFELREGILKHCSLNNAKLLGDVGERFIKKEQPSLEAQASRIWQMKSHITIMTSMMDCVQG